MFSKITLESLLESTGSARRTTGYPGKNEPGGLTTLTKQGKSFIFSKGQSSGYRKK
jgi:hypothetical protein